MWSHEKHLKELTEAGEVTSAEYYETFTRFLLNKMQEIADLESEDMNRSAALQRAVKIAKAATQKRSIEE
jgi:hypothetical protein